MNPIYLEKRNHLLLPMPATDRNSLLLSKLFTHAANLSKAISTSCILKLQRNTQGMYCLAVGGGAGGDSGWRDIPMEATAAAILVQAMLQSSPPLQGSLREDLQKRRSTGRCGFLEAIFYIAVARDADEGGRKKANGREKTSAHDDAHFRLLRSFFTRRVLPMAYAFLMKT